MKIDPNDPRLKAYALGELSTEQREQLEAQLAEEENLRLSEDGTAELARMLRDELATEPSPGLTDGQRLAISAKLSRRRRHGPLRIVPLWIHVLMIMGLMAILFLSLLIWQTSRQNMDKATPTTRPTSAASR